jgi:outer membrane protein OmpA-like peptidoglycan-associated protein
MNSAFKSLAPGAAVAAALLLTACASQPRDVADVACPPVQIAVPADRLGHNNEAGELRFVAVMDELISSCRQADDNLEVEITFTMSAERGPAFDDEELDVTYFLATVDPNRDIVDKQILSVRLDLGDDKALSALSETVTLSLPAATEASGANYSLYLGFQPDQQPGQREARASPPARAASGGAAAPTPESAASRQSAPSIPKETQTGTVRLAEDGAVEIVFALNSSVLPSGAEDRLGALIQSLDKGKRYMLRVQTSLDSQAQVVGASAEETQRYNTWLAERRAKRVENWLLSNQNGVDFSIAPSLVEDDRSRRVRIEPVPIG